MAFESVKEKGVSWNPCTTGRKKEGTLKQLNLIGTRHGAGPDGNSTIHTVKFDKVGDASHFSAEVEKGDEVQVWGSKVLNDDMAKINPGSYIKVEWLGLKQSKAGNNYHAWDIGIDRTVEPLSGAASFSADTESKDKVETAVAGDIESFEDDGDDLPF
jgi:hypothetical protein